MKKMRDKFNAHRLAITTADATEILPRPFWISVIPFLGELVGRYRSKMASVS